PSEVVIALLARAGARVVAFDPMAMAAARPRLASYPFVSLANDPLDAVEDADALIIVTEWDQFRRVDWTEVRERMRRPWVYDGRNLCDPAKMAALGLIYRSVGRPNTAAFGTTYLPERASRTPTRTGSSKTATPGESPSAAHPVAKS